eukprot:TRINITY_DN60943_c0_g1_i1.p1 TRINITY_DN60943_c0_g1~~TRINITY_DN60943_c0_g1_i1.p1  ORF type:complete len:222 (+),score=25.01 TRINITY_DN60943_c0_g1_i1:600-1265(+)
MEKPLIKTLTGIFKDAQYEPLFTFYARALWKKLKLSGGEGMELRKLVMFDLMALPFLEKEKIASRFKEIAANYCPKGYEKFIYSINKLFFSHVYPVNQWKYAERAGGVSRPALISDYTELLHLRLCRMCPPKPTVADSLACLKSIENFKRLEFEQHLNKQTIILKYQNPLLFHFTNCLLKHEPISYIDYDESLYVHDWESSAVISINNFVNIPQCSRTEYF